MESFRMKRRTNFDKVFVRYLKSNNKALKPGFVAEYYRDIADKLVERGQVEIITDANQAAVAKAQIEAVKDKAVITKKNVDEE
jgi:hypothetical protein